MAYVKRGAGGEFNITSPDLEIPFEDAGSGVVRTTVLTPFGGGVIPTFTRATTATTIGSTGLVIKGVASGSPRSRYDPTSLAYQGYFAEGARTNICLRSEELDNAVWVKSNVTVTANDAISPDGTQNADLLTATAGNGTVIQDLGVIGSTAQCGSFYLKRKTGTGNIDLTLDGGSTWTTVAVTADWARFQMTQTLANPDFGIRIVTDTDAIWAWGGQVE